MVSANPRFHRSEDQFRMQCERVIEKAVQEGRITPRDKELLQMFISEIRATANICNSRSAKITGLLVGSRRWIGPFSEVETGQLYLAIDKINNHPDFTRNTKSDILKSLKRFLLWMIESGYSSPSLDEKKVMKIKSPGYQPNAKITADTLLTEDEIRLMIEHANSSRNRAIIGMLYEGGFRIGELGELKWRQVQFTDWNASISTSFKTGKCRHVPLVMSRPYLQAYANEYQGSIKPDSFVFLTKAGKPLQYEGVLKMLRETATRAGVTRHITPHLFRHSRITHLIRQGYRESSIKMMMWGTVESDMFKTYLHLVDADLDDEVKTRLGIKTRGRPTNESRILEPLQCPRCYTVNSPTSRFCDQCGGALTPDAAETTEIASNLLSDLLTGPQGEDILRELILLQKKKIPAE